MNIFLNDLVTLNKVILENAQQQFSIDSGNLFKTFSPLPVDLVAEVCTENVSGETRYQIATSTDGTSWTMTLSFELNKSVEQMPYVVLSFSQLGNDEEMIFDSVTLKPVSNQYVAQLKLTKLEQRDSLLRALSNYESLTTLVVAIKSDNGLLNTITDPKTFYFAETYYPYIYKGIAPPPSRMELVLIPMEYKNVWYNYYQNNITKDYLYYLPDAFLLAENSKDNNKPMLSISFLAPENAKSLSDINVTFDYFLLPKVDKDRIASALVEFNKMQANGKLIPFSNADSLKLLLSLPAGKTEEKDALINLQSGIVDSFTLPSQQFAIIWDALFDTSAQSLLLKGYLDVHLVDGFNPEHILVQIALDAKYKDKVRDFIKQSAPVDINKTIEFRSDSDIYNPSHKNPVKRILVNINNQTIELNRSKPSQSVDIKISVLNIIINPVEKLVYHYDLQIFYADGTKVPYNDQASSYEIIYVP